MQKFKTILLFGTPGAGKGTQGKILGKVPGFFHLACGDVFRSLDMGSDLGKQFIAYSSRGELVPDELTIELWRQLQQVPRVQVKSDSAISSLAPDRL